MGKWQKSKTVFVVKTQNCRLLKQQLREMEKYKNSNMAKWKWYLAKW